MVVAPSCLSLEFVILNKSEGSQNRKKRCFAMLSITRRTGSTAILFLKNFDSRANIL